MLAVDSRAEASSYLCRVPGAAALACASLVMAVGCSEIVPAPAAQDVDAGPSEDDGRAFAGTAGSAGSGGSKSDAGQEPMASRCGVVPSDPRPCEDGELELGYFAVQLADDQAFTCMPVERNYCDVSPLPFATLSECLAQCVPDARPSTTPCQEPGELEPACEPTEDADRARLEAQTPLGELQLTRAWLERIHGFTLGIRVHFSARLEARFDARPSVTVTLDGPFDARDLVGEHDVHATVTLCDRSFDIPVRVMVSADELSSGASERFEATLESLAPDIELQAEVAFSRVCTFTNSL